MTTHQDIYGELEKLLLPASLPAPWHRLPAPPDYRAPLRNCRAAVDLLRQKFSDDELASAGVIKRWREGAQAATRLAINPCLVLRPLLLLRRKSGQPPYEIVSAGGCISGSEPPLLAALQDAATQCLLTSGGTLFATFTIQDAAILQGLGLPAMPAVGLKKLQGSHFEKFCAALDVRPLITDPWAEEEEEEDDVDDKEDEKKDGKEDEIEDEVCGDDECVEDDNPSVASPPPVTSAPPPIPPPELQQGEPATQAASPHANPSVSPGQPSPQPSDSRRQAIAPNIRDIELCFVAWNLAQLSLDEPKQLAAVVAHLGKLAGRLDLLMDQIFVWRPAPDLAPKLRYALTNNLPKYVRKMLASSRNHSTRPLIVREEAPPSQPLTIREAWEPLQQGGERQDHFRAENVQDFHRMIYREVTAPLLELAESLTDPALKARALVQAHYLSQQVKLLPQLGLGGKAPQPASNGLLCPDDADMVRAVQKFQSDFLDATNQARKISSR